MTGIEYGSGDGKRRAPRLQNHGGTVDDHGREPGSPSRTGTGSSSPPADPERARRANRSKARVEAEEDAR